MSLKKKQPIPSGPESPYLEARREWLERYGDYVASAARWRLICALSMLCCGLSLAVNLYQLNQTKITPYIVEVDKLGSAAAVRPLQESGQVPPRLIQAEIVNLVVNWRTVTADIELQKKLVRKVAAYIGGSASGTIREWYAANNPYQRAESRLVSVDPSGVPLPVSSDSWRITWRETTRNHTGATTDVATYEATVRIVIVPPKTEAQIIANPGGVLVTSLSFAKTLN